MPNRQTPIVHRFRLDEITFCLALSDETAINVQQASLGAIAYGNTDHTAAHCVTLTMGMILVFSSSGAAFVST